MGCACSKGSSGGSPKNSRKNRKRNASNSNNTNQSQVTDNNNAAKHDDNNNNNSNPNPTKTLQQPAHPTLETKNSFNNRQSIIQPNQKHKLDLIYSFSNLPSLTQYLLNSKFEYDQSINNDNDDTEEHEAVTPTSVDSSNLKSQSKKSSLKTNREIQLYISKINNSSDLNNESLFNQLRTYCAQQINNFDLNLIDFNNFNNSDNQKLLNNKYFRRHLSKLILKDLLNINGSSPTPFYSSSFSLFLIYFGDSSQNDLLLPDKIDSEDYKKVSRIQLFQQYYKLNEKQKSYRLKLDLFRLSQQDLDNLDSLLHSINELDDNEFKFKYLKTLQQEEIELITKYADPSSIIWIHLTKSSSSSDQRYLYLLEKLQLQVLTHNYKKINSETVINSIKKQQTGSTSSSSSTSTTNNETINEFLLHSIKSLIDSYLNDVNKTLIQTLAVKIDKSLSKELFKHYEMYKYYKTNSVVGSESKFESLINHYLKLKSQNHPLILYENEDEYYQSSICYSQLISNWLHKRMNSSNNQNTSILYRFTNKTLISSKLSTLFQSILHQLTYLLECHESFAFDSSISQNIHNLLKIYKSKNYHHHHHHHLHENSCEEIVIIIDRLDNLVHNAQDTNYVLDLIKQIYLSHENENLPNVKLIITYVNHQNTHLIKQVKSLFEHLNGDKFIVNTKSLTNDSNLSTNQQELVASSLENIQNQQDSKIFDTLISLLNQSRYGLKEGELIDLVKLNNNSKNNSEIMLIWYTLKYLHILLDISPNLSLINQINDQNNQFLFKLNHQNNKKFTSKLIKSNQQLNNLVYKYYTDLKSIAIISNLSQRSYLELPEYYLLVNNMDHFRLIQQYLLNTKWLVQKSNSLNFNCLYLIHDFDLCSTQQNKDLDLFKSNFYKHLYGYYQDPNQMSSNSSGLPQLVAFSLYNNFLTENLSNRSEYLDHVVFNIQQRLDQPDNKYLYFSHVKFINRNMILTLSEFTNQISVFKINKNDNLELIRSIKLNKSPRDIKLFNKNRVVVLVERNLHLFDLNRCIHLLDLNSTMNPNVPLFEIHDNNHVVLLARNRLSIILMRVPLEKIESKLESIKEEDEMDKRNDDIKINSEDMFLFKVGEDRYLNSLLVSRNGQVMVCGDEVQKPFPLLVWNLSQRKLVYDLRQAKHEFITSIQAIGSSGRYVVCACQVSSFRTFCLIY
jgi:hypothetical protein